MFSPEKIATSGAVNARSITASSPLGGNNNNTGKEGTIFGGAITHVQEVEVRLDVALDGQGHQLIRAPYHAHTRISITSQLTCNVRRRKRERESERALSVYARVPPIKKPQSERSV
jgi:hypothetical protein